MSSQQRVAVLIQRLDEGLDLPRYAYEGDAGLDLRSAIDIELKPFERFAIPTGIAIALPRGYAGFVQPRSGLAIRNGLSLVNTPGLIDADYRGEIKVIAINLDPSEPIQLHRGDRIAQLVILQVPIVDLQEVDSLDETERGSKGFGSSSL